MKPQVVMALVEIDCIHIDPAYQRDLDEKRANKVAEKFKQGAAKAVSLSRRKLMLMVHGIEIREV